ncbi:hypothetical protein FHX82_004178 [Amycolatopsis bartoniae]|uniref:SRPBCC family protein n=1 Tax=Amycolatopsis bartoniae TaxID=941986 RepID=A0A8H9MB00_9PSEU|nr:hypothetical protein [Amycolatopsis bartoniae]MBB2937114.1 hypothetical protein [Amycolatopsis bartoniae]TVS98816.1 hypothetical protein FNH07_36605 [Amycolatopsis bartoniae]GHF52526.1 hypothetical protein GCM10017566_27370 [Amycolatopsis bartoniae]
MNGTEIREALLADHYAPRYDVMQTRHLVTAVPAADAYRALRDLDFTTVGGFGFWLRGRPAHLTFDDLAADSGWVVLGERPGAEIAAGVAWRPTLEWRRIEPAEFPAFAEPGWGKIVFSLSAAPYGESRALLTSDVRVALNDTAGRAKFRAYWAILGPIVGGIQAAALRAAGE